MTLGGESPRWRADRRPSRHSRFDGEEEDFLTWLKHFAVETDKLVALTYTANKI